MAQQSGPLTFWLARTVVYKFMFSLHQWQRDPRNPVFRPGPEAFDETACMNPCVLRRGDEYYMFYGGGDRAGHRRICLATTPVNDITAWTKHGSVFDHGEPGCFDEMWAVLPSVYQFNGKWHMYYTGRNSRDPGLQSFCGIGLALSDDLFNWKRVSEKPILEGYGIPEFPDNRGIAGSSIQELQDASGKTMYRMYHVLTVGTPSPDLRIDQAKYCATVDSYDGYEWFNKQILFRPRPEVDYENAAATAPKAWRVPSGWRGIYSAIGTRFGAYSICEAVSRDGIHWDRGEPGKNLSLAPQGDGWESEMVEYTSVVEEEGRLRLFYCGNGYGATGIGTAVAEKLDI